VVRRAPRPGEVGEQPGNLSRPAELEAALQRGHGAGAVALIELEGAEERLANRLRTPNALASVSRTHAPWMALDGPGEPIASTFPAKPTTATT
jgi:hypothetical protein